MAARFRYLVWLLLALPAVYLLARYLSDAVAYGRFIHQTGDASIALLVLALAATPLRRAFPRASWVRGLLRHRRAIGVASFAYAALHTGAYLERKWGHGYILQEGLAPELLTGWLAMLIMLLLAVTSNNTSVRTLKRGWQTLHRAVYLAAALSFGHWILTTIEPQLAVLSLALLLGLQSLRLLRTEKKPGTEEK